MFFNKKEDVEAKKEFDERIWRYMENAGSLDDAIKKQMPTLLANWMIYKNAEINELEDIYCFEEHHPNEFNLSTDVYERVRTYTINKQVPNIICEIEFAMYSRSIPSCEEADFRCDINPQTIEFIESQFAHKVHYYKQYGLIWEYVDGKKYKMLGGDKDND